MVDYRRYYLNGGSWFFTVNLRDRKSRFLVQRIDALRRAVAIVLKQKPFDIDAWVVLPNTFIASGPYLTTTAISHRAGEQLKSIFQV